MTGPNRTASTTAIGMLVSPGDQEEVVGQSADRVVPVSFIRDRRQERDRVCDCCHQLIPMMKSHSTTRSRCPLPGCRAGCGPTAAETLDAARRARRWPRSSMLRRQ